MELRKLFDDDSAVSPVIGVILMVAITVILAAVIATFVLGLGEQVSESAPQASFSFDYASGEDSDDFGNTGAGNGALTVTHAGGETLKAGNLKLTGSSASDDPAQYTDASYDPSSKVSAGDSVTLQIDSGDTIRVVWTNDQGTNSATLREWAGPDA